MLTRQRKFDKSEQDSMHVYTDSFQVKSETELILSNIGIFNPNLQQLHGRQSGMRWWVLQHQLPYVILDSKSAAAWKNCKGWKLERKNFYGNGKCDTCVVLIFQKITKHQKRERQNSFKHLVVIYNCVN